MLLGAGNAHVLKVEHYAQQSLHLLAGLDLQVLVADDDKAGHGTLLLTFLEHFEGHLDLADLTLLAITVDQGHVHRALPEKRAQLRLIGKYFIRGEAAVEFALCGALANG